MTTNEIQPYTQPAQVVLPDIDPSDRALERIEKQARAMSAAHQLGTALAGTDMVPKDYKDKPDNATAAILYGAELGLTAIQSLQNIFVVRGKPAMYARTMVAIVIAGGHRAVEVEASAESATWYGRRADNGDEFTATWTIDRAKKAKFTTNDLYSTQPTEMLRAKAQTELCKTLFADVLLGMSHSVEDLNLEQPIHATVERVAPRQRGVAGLGAALGITAPEPASNEGEKVDTEQAAEVEVEMATPAQQKRIAELLDIEKLDTRQQKLDYLEGQFGRKFTSVAKLTHEEAAQLIGFLEDAQAGDAQAAQQ